MSYRNSTLRHAVIRASKNRMKAAREQYENAYLPWGPKDDQLLELLFSEGNSTERLSLIFKRNPGAIASRIRKLHLVEKYIE